MERYVCIHGHFYQPPRENPWLEAIELQDSAFPYHDWNERITAECYATNATSRILDDQARIVQIVNNYSKISFNFGPTLLAWMQKNAPDVYQAVLQADRDSRERFSGHGSALAQAYNHMILPLANNRDKRTQVIWGIRDFEHHFGRRPEGMWLPETAVDLETLDILAEQEIRFTILAPRQAHRARAVGGTKWRNVEGGRIDPTRPYIQRLPSGRSITLFFYDGPISRAVAFEGLLSRGESLAQRIVGAFSGDPKWPQIVHIATDGESYGHHHPHGDMALAYAIHYIESHQLAQLTNYGEYLERHPPTHEVEIFENSSWSCVHGIERWHSDCGCHTGAHPGWNQAWRRPLREAFDWLRDNLLQVYEEKGPSFFKEPWESRDAYINVILDRSPENLEAFFGQHGVRMLDSAEGVAALKLLEIQRHAMLMYTSCGWFFDEISGIETVQVIQYAGRALQLAQELVGDTLEAPFLVLLEAAKSNVPAHQDGRVVYGKSVKPAALDLAKVIAHYAISSLFEDYEEQVTLFSYRIDLESYKDSQAGRTRLALGRAKITSEITREADRFCFGILHWGDHNISGFVRRGEEEEPHQTFMDNVGEVFSRADFPMTLQSLENYFGSTQYSLRNLFRDEQRRIVHMILQSTLEDVEGIYHQIYESNAPLLRFLKDLGIPRPGALGTAADFLLNLSLRRAFEEENLDMGLIQHFLDVSVLEGASLDQGALEITIRKGLEKLAEQFLHRVEELPLLQKMDTALDITDSLPFRINLRDAQNRYYEILQREYPKFRDRADTGDEEAGRWVSLFTSLGAKLSVRVNGDQ
jgi:alpha-amylase/alpha-mannosidase (GH57 family)